jgi:hypothetical protein
LEHPFVALQAGNGKARWVSPKSTLDAAFWESESEDEEEEDVLGNASERIKSLSSCSVSASPDWDSDDGWTDVLGEEQCDEARLDSPATKEEPADVSSGGPRKAIGSAAVPAEGVAVVGSLPSDEQLDADHQDKAGSSWERDVMLCWLEIVPCNRINKGREKFRFTRILLFPSDISFFILSFEFFFLSFTTAVFWTRSEFQFHVWRKHQVGLTFIQPLKKTLIVLFYTVIKRAVRSRSGTLHACDTTAAKGKETREMTVSSCRETGDACGLSCSKEFQSRSTGISLATKLFDSRHGRRWRRRQPAPSCAYSFTSKLIARQARREPPERKSQPATARPYKCPFHDRGREDIWAI